MSNKPINERLPWHEILAASRHKETPWVDVSTAILESIEALNLDLEEMGIGGQMPMPTIDKIGKLFDQFILDTEREQYYMKMSIRFSVFQSIVGVIIRQAMQLPDNRKDERQVLMQLAHAIIVRSVQQVPFTIDEWKKLAGKIAPEAHVMLFEILCRVEETIMIMTGNTVYSYFDSTCSKEEVDVMLDKAKAAVEAAEKVRALGPRHGDGHSKLILQYVILWQEDDRMKKVTRIMPFLQCLKAHWHTDISLGCRQGVEKMYAKKTLFR